LLNSGCHADGASFASKQSHNESVQSNSTDSSLSSPARSYISDGIDVAESKVTTVPETAKDDESAVRSYISESFESKNVASTEAIQDALQSSTELPDLAKADEQPATDVSAAEEELSLSMPETGKQFASVAMALQFSELLIALDPSLAEPGLAEKASDQVAPEVSADEDASELQLAGAQPRLAASDNLGSGSRQAQSGNTSLAVAALLPSALRGLKRATALAQRAKEHVQKTTGDMIDVELAYVPV
jgi:hypothetical protein